MIMKCYCIHLMISNCFIKIIKILLILSMKKEEVEKNVGHALLE